MGTMLTQKKPLESIQRSQAINFVAEIFYDELQFILDRRLVDHTMVNCHGMNSRVKSRDVLSVSVQHIAATNADKEYILLNLARNSIYHQLPELLFHPLVLSTPGMSNKEIVEAIRANEKQDKELIQFFAPFDTEFFRENSENQIALAIVVRLFDTEMITNNNIKSYYKYDRIKNRLNIDMILHLEKYIHLPEIEIIENISKDIYEYLSVVLKKYSNRLIDFNVPVFLSTLNERLKGIICD